MTNPRISYLNISPYSRHSPSIQLKSDLKKQSSSLERPKSSKANYSGATTRGQTPINQETTERKYSPHIERKSNLMASLYQMAKVKQKEKPAAAKTQKIKDIPAKKVLKPNSKPSSKVHDKLAIYQYLQSKSGKRSEESKILHPSIQQTLSRQASKSHFQEEKDISHERKLPENGTLQQQQLIEALEEMHRSRNKSGSSTQNHHNLALLLKSTQKLSQINTGRGLYVSSPPVNVASTGERALVEPTRNELFKDLKLNMNSNEPPKQKEHDMQAAEGSILHKKHRRGLSSGQNPLCIDQLLLEQEREREMERERIRQMQQAMKDPQQEEDEFFEEFFHMDKMTFSFEKLMILQKNKQPQFFTPAASPTSKKHPIFHSRNKSIDDPNSHLPTKSSSRWTSKKSLADDAQNGGRENFNLIEQISDFDKAENEKDEMKRYYKV